MQNQSMFRALLCAAAILGAGSSQAADFSFTGNLFNNTDRVDVAFELASAGDVKLWTDSWQGGLNFDPISVLWRKTGTDFTLVQENDDNDSVALGQGFYDTGHALAGLEAGSYLLSVGPAFAGESYAAGMLFSQGFTQDGTTPTPIAQWNQPSYDINYGDQKGTFYSIHLSGVDSASISAVPEPEAFALLLAGLCLVGAAARRTA